MTVAWCVIGAVCALVLAALVLLAFLAWEICAEWEREDVFGDWDREPDGESDGVASVFSAPRAGTRAQTAGQ